jgi:hypothetical protein
MVQHGDEGDGPYRQRDPALEVADGFDDRHHPPQPRRSRRRHRVTWLFPGGQPGRPISADRLGARLRALGLRPAQVRSTALFQLATELPAAVLARLLGIHINVAVQWQQHSAGDWTNYAADLSRRPQSLVSNHEVPG